MKKAFLAIFLVLALTALAVGPSQAAWYTCTVYATGVSQAGPTTYYGVYLTDTAGSFTKNCQRELLATMLTASASGQKIAASITGNQVNAAYVGDY
jgi:hypothetical protein